MRWNERVCDAPSHNCNGWIGGHEWTAVTVFVTVFRGGCILLLLLLMVVVVVMVMMRIFGESMGEKGIIR